MNLFKKSRLKATVSTYCKWVCVFFLLGWGQSVFAQNRLSAKVNQAKALNPVYNYKVFSQPLAAARLSSDTVFVAGASVYRFDLDATELNRLSDEKKPYLEMSLPLTLSQNIELELVPHTIFAPSFKVTDSKGQVLSPRNLGVFYQGIVKGDENSVVSISIINGEIAGIISQKTGNWNLGKEGSSSNYIFFNERDVKNKPTFNCTVQEPDVKAMGQNLIKSQASLPNVACGSVEIYIEVDNALYQAQGSSSTNTVSYVNNLFSKVATLYTNEGLSVVISQIKVWDTADPYVGYNSTSSILSAFRLNIGTTFNGRLAHFLSWRGLGGGIAYLNVLCEKSYAHGVSGSLSSTIVDLPTYSWNVEVVTHEIGHNFGSPHTQSCSWPGGAIDNCYTTEGGCAPGPAPTNGGTIMSYCHLTSTGINFANGFGPLPGDLIRSYTQACLGSAVAPSNLAASEIYATQALVSWTHTSGVYNIEYKPSSSGAWISAGSTGNKNKYLTSLAANTAYDWRVNANCSVFSTGTFTTNSTPSPAVYCIPSFTDACTYGILMTSIQLGGTTLSTSSGCASGGYNYFTTPIKSLALGQPNSFTVNLEGYYNAAQLAIWIDLNKNGTFETTEKLFTTSSGQTQAITGTVTIPVSTALGSTRMRIIVKHSTAPINPCGAYSYGEAEDYNVTIVCPTVTQYNVTGGGNACLGGTGVAVGLSGSQTGLTYQLKRDGTNIGSPISGTGSALSFGNQTVAGSYTVEVPAPSGSCSGATMTGAATITVSVPLTLLAGTVTNPTTCSDTNGSIAFTTTNLPDGSYSLTYTGTGSPKTVTVASNAFVLSGLGAGTYSNFSISNNGCTGTDATSKALTTTPTAPTLSAGTVTHPTTCSGTNGSIAFTTTNLPDGSYSLTYTGTGSPKTVTVASNAFVLSGLGVGTYSNFSISNNGCTGTDVTSKTVNNPAPPTLLAGTVTHPTTCSGTNGSIAFMTTNLPDGSYSLTYTGTGSPKMVSVASNAFVLSGLGVGTYSNFSISSNGCTGTDVTSKTVNNPAPPRLLAGTVTHPTTCSGTNGSIAFMTTNLPDGSYSLTYTGTGSPKTVTVASNAFVLSGLGVGTYSNFSISSNGCTGTDVTSKTVNNPAPPTLLAGTVTHPTTCSGTNGSIAFTTTNLPDGSYSLTYTGTGSPKMVTVASNAFVLSGLGVGTYSNFSISNNGCTGTDVTSKTVNNPAPPTLLAGLVTNPTTCSGTNGSIAFTTTNLPDGSYSLTYTGTGSPKTVTVASNAFVLSGLGVGTYSNFSISNNGCTGTDVTSKTVNNPAPPTLLAGTVTHPTTCSGTNGSIAFMTTNLPDGSYSLTYTGTGSPKTVTVASNAFVLSGLGVGTYSNFSISNNGCTGTDATSKTLTTPTAPTLLAGTVTNPTTCSGTNGSITFTTTNLPDGSYNLTYTGTGSPKTVTVASNAFVLSGLGAGTYSNFSTTDNGCTGTAATSKTLTAPTAPTLLAGMVTNPTTCSGTNGSITFTTTNLPDGSYNLTYTGTGSPKTVTVASNGFVLSGLSAGTYSSFSITDNGCTGTAATSKTLTASTTPTLSAGMVTHPTTCNGTNGSIDFTTTNLPDGSYNLTYTGTGSPKTVTVASNGFVLSGLGAGTYSNFSISSNGCTGTDVTSKTVNNPAPPTLLAGTVTHPTTCSGTNGSIAFTTTNLPDGSYSLTYTGTGSPKTVTITSNGFTLSSLSAGVYSNFSITNNGCTGTDITSKTLTAPLAPTLIAGTATNPTTCGGTDGSISFSTNLPNGNYTLNYTGTGSSKTVTVASNSFTLSGLAAGTYSNFSITNNGCTGFDASSKTLNPPASPNAGTITGTLTICVGTTTTLASNGASGGVWSSSIPSVASINPTTGVATGLVAGSTIISYTVAANGCTSSTTATLTIAPASVGGTVSGSTSVCAGSNTVNLNLTGQVGIILNWQASLTSDFAATINVVNATTSLTVNNLSQTTYFRAVVRNGICSVANSSSAVVTVNPLPVVNITGGTTIPVGGTTTLTPTTGGVWISNNTAKATVTNAGLVTGVAAGTANFTFTQSSTGCSNTTNTVTVTETTPCNQAITLVSPTDDYSSGTVTKQTNLSINATNKISGTGTTVTYQSGSSVTLEPGFKADSGTVFKTQIGGCN